MQIANLTFARFIAAFLVFLHHSTGLQQQIAVTIGEPPASLMRNGFVGVTFFFILSGFILSHVYFASLDKLRLATVAIFYMHRLTRIVPLWFVLSAPMIGLAIYHGHADKGVWIYLAFLQAWSSDLWVAFGPYISVAWTLSVEMFFYALFPFIGWSIYRLSPGNPNRVWLPVCLVAIAVPLLGALFFEFSALKDLANFDPNSAHRWLYRNPLLRIGDFVFGIGLFLAFSWSRSALSSPARKTWGLGLLLGGLVVAVYLMSTFPPSHWTFDFAYVIPFGAIVLGSALVETCDRPLAIGSRFLVLLGEASFAFYLIHVTYGLELMKPLRALFGANEFLFSLFALVFITATSIGLFVAIERPAQKALRALMLARSHNSRLAARDRERATAPRAPSPVRPNEAAVA